MKQINLSEQQARELLYATGWGNDIPRDIEREIFKQLEQQLMPRSTSAAELAVWRHENGLNEMDVEEWKRNHETKRAFDIVCGWGKESNKI